MDLNSLALFVEVAKAGSFAEVSRRRNIDPSSVSRAIAGLEDTLDFRLFQRTTRRLSLTEAGDTFLQRVAPLVDELAIAAASALDMSQAPSGVLRVTTSVSFGLKVLVPLIPSFRHRYPDVDIDLELTDANLDLVAERIDLAIRLGLRPTVDAVSAKLMDTRYRVCVSPGYLEGRDPISDPRQLSEIACLRFPFIGFRNQWTFRSRAGEVAQVPIKGTVTATNALALLRLAIDGQGPVLLADWTVDDAIAEGKLVDLFPDHTVTATDFDTGVWLVYPSGAHLPSKVRVFIDYLRRPVRQGVAKV